MNTKRFVEFLWLWPMGSLLWSHGVVLGFGSSHLFGRTSKYMGETEKVTTSIVRGGQLCGIDFNATKTLGICDSKLA